MDMTIDGREIFICGNEKAENVFVQPLDAGDRNVIEAEFTSLKQITNCEDILLTAFQVKSWNDDLTPWAAPPVFGRNPFGCGAGETLEFIRNGLIPAVEQGRAGASARYYIAGYSLAGLFALWCAYETELFTGAAAVSPSVWYPGWTEYAEERKTKARKVYLSLGDTEENARNPVMASVGKAIRRQYEMLAGDNVETVLEWNPGNHFKDAEIRMAKGMSWLLDK